MSKYDNVGFDSYIVQNHTFITFKGKKKFYYIRYIYFLTYKQYFDS